jgi:hypothetical protein
MEDMCSGDDEPRPVLMIFCPSRTRSRASVRVFITAGRVVCPSRTSEREGKGYCVKGGWREGEERVKERVRRSVNPVPNPDPNPKQAPQMSLKEA